MIRGSVAPIDRRTDRACVNDSGSASPWVQPIYVVVETSARMDGVAQDCAQRIIQAVIDTIRSERVLGSISRLAIIAYNDVAVLLTPLAAVSDIGAPMLAAEDGASYAKAFQLLRRQIDGDHTALKAEGCRVCRPFVLFVTAGEPTCDQDDRRDAFTTLSVPGPGGTPDMAVLGIGHQMTRRRLSRYRIGRSSVTSVFAAAEFADLTATVVARMLASVGADGPAHSPFVDLDVDCGTPFMDTARPTAGSRHP